jgi:RNA polymerase sigma-70 factor, ECF subfamily
MTLLGQKAATMADKLDITKLARQHYDQVFRFCSVRVGYHHAGDAAQETFLTAQRSLSKFRGESQPLTWLIGIALNECRKINRNLKREEPLPEFREIEYSGGGESRIVDREILRNALAGLSIEHREVVTFHEIDGFTYDEIAQITGVPVGTVKSRLYHAFVNLRKQITTSAEVN